jgi:hypothetical protein
MRGVKGSTPVCHCGRKGFCRGMCTRHYQQWRYHNNPKHKQKELLRGKKYHFLKSYGLDQQAIIDLWITQNKQCAICERLLSVIEFDGVRAVVDHDHVTGKIRGLLCYRCNIEVGIIEAGHLDRINKFLHSEILSEARSR